MRIHAHLESRKFTRLPLAPSLLQVRWDVSLYNSTVAIPSFVVVYPVVPLKTRQKEGPLRTSKPRLPGGARPFLTSEGSHAEGLLGRGCRKRCLAGARRIGKNNLETHAPGADEANGSSAGLVTQGMTNRALGPEAPTCQLGVCRHWSKAKKQAATRLQCARTAGDLPTHPSHKMQLQANKGRCNFPRSSQRRVVRLVRCATRKQSLLQKIRSLAGICQNRLQHRLKGISLARRNPDTLMVALPPTSMAGRPLKRKLIFQAPFHTCLLFFWEGGYKGSPHLRLFSCAGCPA